MLDRLRQKLASEPPAVRQRVTTMARDMRAFTLAERFALIIAPFRAFLHNLTEADQLACLARVREHPRPGGRFAFNVFHPSLEFMARYAGPFAGAWRLVDTFPLAGGGCVVRSESTRYDTVHQLVESLHRYEEYGPDATLTRTSLQRLQIAHSYPPDIWRLLTHAGFQSVKIEGGFDGHGFENDMDEAGDRNHCQLSRLTESCKCNLMVLISRTSDARSRLTDAIDWR